MREQNTPHDKIGVRALSLVLISGFVWLAFNLPPLPPASGLDVQLQTATEAIEIARLTRTVSPEQGLIYTLPADAIEVQSHKLLFMAKMLPLIALENDRIRRLRAYVKNTDSAVHLNALAHDYGLNPDNVDKRALLRRIDILPASLVLAQAAIESAWGTSRFAQAGNAYFGERTYDPDAPGIVPKRARGFKVKSFASARLSIRSYMHTLNSHPAYRTFRQYRETLRTKGEPLSGRTLAAHLKAYSELGSAYIKRVTDTISANRLNDFDGIRIKTD